MLIGILLITKDFPQYTLVQKKYKDISKVKLTYLSRESIVLDLEYYLYMINYYYIRAQKDSIITVFQLYGEIMELKLLMIDWCCCFVDGKYDLALKCIEEAFKEIKKETVNREYYDVILYYLKALTYEKIGDYKEAIKYYEAVEMKSYGYGWDTGKKLSKRKLKNLLNK